MPILVKNLPETTDEELTHIIKILEHNERKTEFKILNWLWGYNMPTSAIVKLAIQYNTITKLWLENCTGITDEEMIEIFKLVS